MPAASWLPRLLHQPQARPGSRRVKTAVRRNDGRHRQRHALPLRLERLEDRTLPATFHWVNAAGGNWGTASNWDLNTVPTASDDVVISQTGITVTHSSGAGAVNSLTSQARIALSG